MSVVVSGGGPAGMMLGLMLARAGVEVTVLEKHADFLRDFRGDTVHASTVRLMDELGLGRKFAELPQSRLGNLVVPVPGVGTVALSAFDRLPAPYNYIAMMPQWDLLNFLVEEAKREPAFTVRMNTEATGLLREGGRVVGVRYRTRDGEEGEIRADLTVAADGRHSTLRRDAGLAPREYPVPFDVWWFRLPRHAHERTAPPNLTPGFGDRDMALSLTRDDFFQIAYFNSKGSDARLRGEGIERFRARIARIMPQYADRVDQLASMEESESSESIRARVCAAREVQRARYAKEKGDIRCNAQLDARTIARACAMTPEAHELTLLSCERLKLSNRAYTRILKVARTIADLDGADEISAEHVSEAVQYRTLDRKYWG